VFSKFFRFGAGGINNVAGFRPKSRAGGSTDICDSAFVVLVTNLDEPEWPDHLERESGIFTYYGDNRQPGLITETPVGGNRLLERVFGLLHKGSRGLIQPFLAFQTLKRADGAYMRFLGLACPGGSGVSSLEDLVAVWRIKGDQRFQNYRSVFTILGEEAIARAWLEDLSNGHTAVESQHCPESWRKWVYSGRYNALTCEKQRRPRTKADQLPKTSGEKEVLEFLTQRLTDREFEFAASDIVKWMDSRFTDMEVTRKTADGGRDVLAKYRVGHDAHQVLLEAYVEAKKWKTDSSVGVKPMMRLISRIKHRDMGVFITTSFFERQVQQELIDDGHPVILLSGGDVARLLIAKEMGDCTAGGKLATWITSIKTLVAGGQEEG
jgi:hypothetical protein